MESTEERGVRSEQLMGEGRSVTSEEENKGSMAVSIIRSRPERSGWVAGLCEGQAGLALKSLQGPSRGGLCLSSRSLKMEQDSTRQFRAGKARVSGALGCGNPGGPVRCD